MTSSTSTTIKKDNKNGSEPQPVDDRMLLELRGVALSLSLTDQEGETNNSNTDHAAGAAAADKTITATPTVIKVRLGDRIGIDPSAGRAVLDVLRGRKEPASGEIVCTPGVRISVLESRS